MNRYLVLLGAALGCFPGVAAAGDAPSGAAPGYDWGGLYLGGSIGYGGGSTGNSWRNSLMPLWDIDGAIRYGSVLGGAHAGVQHQYGSFVVGAEADFTMLRFRGDDSRFAGVVNALEIDHVGTARARLGWADDRSLFYVTGGVAYAEITKKDVSFLSTETKAKAVGWAAGGGYERAFGENWLGRLEYQRVDLGKAETFLQDPMIGGYSHRADSLTFDAVRVGLSYKF